MSKHIISNARCRLFLLCLCAAVSPADRCWSAETVSFAKQIAPILLNECVACHGAKKAEAGYRVDRFDELFKAGDSGENPLARSKEETSELLRRVSTDDESERMPAESDPLTAEQIELVRLWIQQGAKFDGQSPSDPLAVVIPPPRYADPPQSYQQGVPATAIAFSPDGGQLIVGGYHELMVWDANDPKLVRRIKNIGQRSFSIAFDVAGKMLAVGCGQPGRSGEVRLIDYQSGEVLGVIARTSDVVLDVAFRPGTDELAVASADNLIRIFDIKKREEVRSIASHADCVNDVGFSDDGSRLVSASRDKSAKVFDADTGQVLSSYQGHDGPVRGATILPDGKQVISTDANGKLHRWNIEGGKRVAEIALAGETFKLVRNQDFVLIPCSDLRLRQVDLKSNKVTQQYQDHADWVVSTALAPGGKLIASGCLNGEVRIWNATDGSLLHAWLAKP